MLYQRDNILYIQRFTRLEITSLLYMIALLLLLISLFTTDVGFFKFTLVIGLIVVVFAFTLSIVHNRTRYMVLRGDEHTIIVQHVVHEDNTTFNFYKRKNLFVYSLIGESPNPNTYDTTFHIDDDKIILDHCDDTTCFTVYVDIE